MVRIDRLSLTLPAAYRPRAGEIARRVADELATLSWDRSRRLETLRLPPITAEPGLDARRLAARIARSIHRQTIDTGGR